MAFLSEIYKGLIYAGETPLEWDGSIEQTGSAQITIQGTLTTTDGWQYELSQVFDLPDGDWRIALGANPGDTEALAIRQANQVWPDSWQPKMILVGFSSSIKVEAGEIVGNVYVLKVEPGFPLPPS